MNRHLPYHCPDCLELARGSLNAAQEPQVPEQFEVGSVDTDTGLSDAVQDQPLYKSICAPIYELKKKYVSGIFTDTIHLQAVVLYRQDLTVVQWCSVVKWCSVVYM
jgi:hypothetical protein